MKSFVLTYFACSLLFLQTSFAQPGSSQATVTVSGEVTNPLKLTVADLGKMKQETASLAGKDGKTQQFSGVSIREILKLAGVTTGAELRGENLTKYLLVKCADGYQVVFSLAELDESFTDRIVILADKIEGKPLSADRGPFRLIVPGEKKPARSSHQVVSMEVKFAK